jgi:hypothetical protein
LALVLALHRALAAVPQRAERAQPRVVRLPLRVPPQSL